MKAKKNNSTVSWWIGWIVLTIGSFFVSFYFWTALIAERVGTMRTPGASVLWVATVFGTWMLLLVPLIVVMYNKVDRAYEEARMAREKNCGVKSIYVADSERLLDKALTAKLKNIPWTIKRGHLVTAILRDGRRIENVFVRDRSDVLGVYGANGLSFNVSDIADLEPMDLDKLPAFKTEGWLRLDGAGGS